MKPFDLAIKGGEAILAGRGRTVCDIAIRDGKIAAILAPGETVPAQEEMPARGLVVMPGGVDVHLHLGHGKDIARPREPLDADRETAAAAKGGVTTFIPYLMATEPFEATSSRSPNKARASISAITLSFRPKRNSPASPAMSAITVRRASRSS